MKKLIVIVSIVIICTTTIYNIRCEEVFIAVESFEDFKVLSDSKINQTSKEAISTINDNTIQNTKEAQQASISGKNKRVRIVLKGTNKSIYYSMINLKSKSLSVYYGKNYSQKTSCESIKLDTKNKLFKQSNVIKIDSKTSIKCNGGNDYKGIMYIYKEKYGLVIVNDINLEDYVAAVISSEIGENSPIEALKAQAVCARTFISRAKSETYQKYDGNGDDTTDFQVYNKNMPGKNCVRAAKETKNEVMTYNGNLINAYYFSTSCGKTTDYKIWGKDKMKYLSSVSVSNNEYSKQKFKDFITSRPEAFEDECPFYRWKVYLSTTQIQNSLYNNLKINLGKVEKIEVNSRGKGGIAKAITIYGTGKDVAISNQNQIRKALSPYYSQIELLDGTKRTGMDILPSAFVYIKNIWKNGKVCGVQIYGGGFGHGSGMSQNGAIAMANEKKNYREILQFFYKNIVIK